MKIQFLQTYFVTLQARDDPEGLRPLIPALSIEENVLVWRGKGMNRVASLVRQVEITNIYVGFKGYQCL